MRTVMLAAAMAAAAGMASAQVAETPKIAKRLQELGTELTKELSAGTSEFYAPLHQQGTDDGLSLSRDHSYGPHERHVLDVYAPEDADGTQPILVFVHGGGFVRGDKSGAANVGRWFARNGIVTIPINYRFAPENTWPSGAEDLAMVLDWVAANADQHGGDTAKIVLAGNSAGSMHVADYVFREELQRENDGVIGAILASTPTVDLNARELDPQRDLLYYGAEGDRAAQSVINALDGREIPLMIAYAELEPDVIIDQVRLLIEGVAERDGRLPLVVAAPGHNHLSIVQHIGTADEALAREMLGFINLRSLLD